MLNLPIGHILLYRPFVLAKKARWSWPGSVDTSFFVFKESQMSKVRAPYPAEFRQQMVELVRAGRSPAQLSREFGVTAQSITN